MPVTSPQGTLDFKKVDKITFVGASSNTVIDTTTGSVGIGVVGDALSSNLHVVGDTRMEGNINMLHTSNTASIKLNSNVVTEFPRSKKLIKYPRVALTSAAGESSGYQGYKVTSSFHHSSFQDWEAFDDSNGDTVGWHTADGVSREYNNGGEGTYSGTLQTRLASNTELGEWLQIELPDAIRLERYVITPQGGGPGNWGNCPGSAVVYGSNDGTAWKELHRYNDEIVDGAPNVNYPFDVKPNETYYRRFAIVVTKRGTAGGSGYGVSIEKWELYGIPEYDPEAHGTDVKVISYPNVPNTDWLKVYYDAKDLENGAVTSVDDLTPNGTNDGTPYGGINVSDGAFVFDGTNDYITTSALGFSGDQVHSVSIWFRSDRPQTDMTTENGIYGFGHSNNLYAGLSWWSPVTNPSSSLRFWHSGSAGKNFPGTTFLEGKWNHVVLVYLGDGAFNSRAWLNGVELTGVNGTGSGGNNYDFNWSTGDNVIIGDWYSGSNPRLQSPWHGKIANFRLFNRVLTTDEIYQLYAYQKEYFGHGDLSMTLKAGRLGIGTSEPRAMLDVQGIPHGPGSRPCWRMLGNGVNDDGIWNWNTVQLDNFGAASGSTYYIIPVSGYYFMQVVIIISATSGRALLRFRQNNVTIGPDFIQDPITTAIDTNRPWNQLMGMITHYFNKGDQVTVYSTGSTYGGHNCFTGFHLGF